MRLNRFLRWPGASLALGLCLALLGGCVDPEQGAGGATGGTALYAFDTAEGATNRVLIWDNLPAAFEGDALPATSRSISSDQFTKVKNLAWGGLMVDSSGNRLWMVGETGDVVRVERIRQQSGSIPTAEAVSFKLGNSSDRLNNGKFSQAALDPSNGALYVMETSDSDARVWVVSNPLVYRDGDTVTQPSKIGISGDKAGTGLAAAGGSVFAFFNEGNQIQFSTETFSGPRLRSGSASGFAPGSVLIGSSTRLYRYGSLALDTSNNRIYFAAHNQDTGLSGAPISVFTFGQFGSNPNQAPDRGTLGTPSMNAIRVLAHPGNKDWLAALDSLSGEAPTNVIRLFKGPSGSSMTVKAFTLDAAVKLKGVALDGNA
jgi:hypothetical protein